MARRTRWKAAGRRGLSLFMALVMCVSLLQLTAFAADPVQEQAEKQIMSGYYVADDETKTVTANTTAEAVNQTEGGNVAVSKTIAATGTENLFEVTLEVQTKQKLSETVSSPAAAVTLVLDRSGSMDYCAECGGDHASHKFVDEGYWSWNGWTNRPDGKCDTCGRTAEHHVTRMEAAQAGAIAFMDQLRADTPKNEDGTYASHRYVSVVSFSSKTDDSYGKAPTVDCDWVDITTDAGYAAAVAAINGVKAGGGTYLQGGLKKAVEQMKKTDALEGTVDITAISNRYTVVLTDGVPTFSDTDGNGTACSKKICDETAKTAADLRALSNVYSICYGADSDTCYSTSTGWGKPSVKVTVGDFLSTISMKYFSADDIDQLNTAFGSISDLIALLAQAWMVTDPMGDHMAFEKITSGQGTVLASCQNGTLTWDLKGDAPVRTEKKGDTTTYIYQLTYQVTLRTEDAGFVADTYQPANGYTYLTYVFYNEDGQIVDEDGNVLEDQNEPNAISFHVPGVKGYLGELSFDKRDPADNVVEGAKFTLTCKDCGIAHTVVATSVNGKVEFTGAKSIPSGHTYIMTEEAPAGYQSTSETHTVEVRYGAVTVDGAAPKSDMVIVNKHDPAMKTLTITKRWLPSAPAAGSVTVALYQGEELVDTIEISAANSWKAATEVATKSEDNGQSIVGSYTVKEVTGPDGYVSKDEAFPVTADAAGNLVCTVTNVRSAETSITVEKVWVDGSSSHPSVTLGLMANGQTPSAALTCTVTDSSPSHTFSNVPQYDENGNEITYTVAEQVGGQWVTSGSVTIGGKTYTVTTNGTAVINTIAQENSVAVSGHKEWVDGSNEGNTRPDSLEVQLYADGKDTGIKAAVNADNTFAFDAQPKYAIPNTAVGSVTYGADADGHEIVYTVWDSVSGYTMTQAGAADNHYTVINKLDVIDSATKNVTVTKVWEDDNNADGTRPESVELILVRTSNGPADTTLNETYTFEQVAGSYQSQESYTFEDMKVYDEQGYRYTYTVLEAGETNSKLAGKGVQYAVSYDGTTVTNSLDSASATTQVTAHKVWVAPAGEETEVTIHLLADGETVETSVLDGTEETPWTHTFSDLPVYEGGKKIAYTVVEDAVEGYTSAVSKQAEGIWTVTNTIEQDLVSVSVDKTWRNGTATIPASLTVTLKADDQVVGTCELTAGGWSHSWTELPRYAIPGTTAINGTSVTLTADGHAIRYTVEEEAAAGYTLYRDSRSENDGDVTYQLVNEFDAGVTSFQVNKIWKAEERASAVYAGLFADGVYVESAELSETNGWSYTFENLPRYSDVNKTIVYTVREMDGASDTQGTASEITLSGNTYQVNIVSGAITNTQESDQGGKTVVYTIDKVWKGPSSQDVSFGLYVKGDDTLLQKIFPADMEQTAANVWSGKFDAVNRFDSDGKRVQYEVKEISGSTVADSGTISIGGIYYDVETTQAGNGFVVTNTVVETNNVTVSGTKTWNMDEAPASVKIPDGIVVELYANDVYTGKSSELGGDDWSYSWTDLPRYDSETHMPITYTVREQGAYVTTLNGEELTMVKYGDNYYAVTCDAEYNITNTFHHRDVYRYRVDRVYNRYVNGKLTESVTVDGTLIEGEKDQTVTDLDTTSYKNADQKSGYTYVSGYPTLGEAADEKVGVILEESDKEYVITLVYEYRTTERPDPSRPGRDDDDDDDRPSRPVEIPDEDTPTTDLPDTDVPLAEPDEPLTELADEEVPLAEVPKTGDASILWAMAAAVSGLGLVWMTISGKKRREEER